MASGSPEVMPELSARAVVCDVMRGVEKRGRGAARASNTCGGTLIRRARPDILGLLNGTVQAGGQHPGQSTRCVITVGVRATAPGSLKDTTGRVTAANALAARPATARVTVRRT